MEPIGKCNKSENAFLPLFSLFVYPYFLNYLSFFKYEIEQLPIIVITLDHRYSNFYNWMIMFSKLPFSLNNPALGNGACQNCLNLIILPTWLVTLSVITLAVLYFDNFKGLPLKNYSKRLYKNQSYFQLLHIINSRSTFATMSGASLAKCQRTQHGCLVIQHFTKIEFRVVSLNVSTTHNATYLISEFKYLIEC